MKGQFGTDAELPMMNEKATKAEGSGINPLWPATVNGKKQYVCK
jgi:hypothetical protein